MICRQRREGFCCLFIALRSSGRKICLNMCHRNSENSDVVHTFAGFAKFTKVMWVYRGVESLCKFWPPPPSSFSGAILDSRSSFFAPKPHGNACYAGYSNVEQGAFSFTNKRLQVEILSMLELVWFESFAGNDFSERGTQAEARCERNLNRQLWSIRRHFWLFKEFLWALFESQCC